MTKPDAKDSPWKCTNCAAFQHDPEDAWEGTCHAGPPSVLVYLDSAGDPVTFGSWPPAEPDGWCMQFKPKN